MSRLFACANCNLPKATSVWYYGRRFCQECFQKAEEAEKEKLSVKWTCENCAVEKETPGTSFEGKKVCTDCFHKLTAEKEKAAADAIPQHRSNIVNVAHYGGWAVDVFIEEQGLGFRLGNVVKYVARAGKKDASKDVEDLEKARAYLSREITRRRIKLGLPEEPEKK